MFDSLRGDDGARRFSSNVNDPYEPPPEPERRRPRRRRPRRPYDGRRLSEVARLLMERMQQDGVEKRTLDETRYAIFALIKFLAQLDPPLPDPIVDQLRARYPRRPADRPTETPSLLAQFLRWLRQTPIARNTRLPEVTPGGVAAFLQKPPKQCRAEERPRGQATIARYSRTVARLLRIVRVSTDLTRREKPKTRRPPLRRPNDEAIAAWWQYAIEKGRREGIADKRIVHESQRAVLFQGLLYLSGMRLFEAAAVPFEDLDGHWLLLRRTKTHMPRLIYLNSQALALAGSLRTYVRLEQTYLPGMEEPAKQSAQSMLCGWSHSLSYLKKIIKRRFLGCPNLPAKPNQMLRIRATNYMRNPPRWVIERHEEHWDLVGMEAAQLGHGKMGVVEESYLASIERLPELLEPFALPEIPGKPWPKPLSRPQALSERLYAELCRLYREGQFDG